jgi:predicted kinase
MKTVFMTIGFSGSGKSTYAREYAKYHPDTKIVSPDGFRTMFNGEYKYLPEMDDVITQSTFDTAENLLQAGYNVIIDCGNLTKADDRRGKWKKLRANKFVAFLMPKHKPVDWYVKRRKKNPHWDKVDMTRIVENEMRAFEPPTLDEFDKIIKIKE